MNNNLKNSISREKKHFDKFLKKILNKTLIHSYLNTVIKYSTSNGGKRIRPYLVKKFAKIKKLKSINYNRLSVAIELIHSYSLIHDDLPSMDNDDYRRGKLSAHKRFDEAQAILAGDSLHDLAFEILSDERTHKKTSVRIKLVNLLSQSIGSLGLAGGQSLDLLYEKKNISLKEIKKMYQMKTGQLFKFCCVAPFIMSNASKKEIIFASNYGLLFGLIFQIVDDHIDNTGKKNNIGKTPGKDKKQNKSTIINYFNNKNLDQYCEKIINKFFKENKYFFNKWPILKKLLINLLDQLK